MPRRPKPEKRSVEDFAPIPPDVLDQIVRDGPLLKTRGCHDMLIAVTDGLKGLSEALAGVFPATTLQTCIVPLLRHSLDYAIWKERKRLAAALRPIYTAASADIAAAALDAFERSPWGARFPTVVASWRRAWPYVIPSPSRTRRMRPRMDAAGVHTPHRLKGRQERTTQPLAPHTKFLTTPSGEKLVCPNLYSASPESPFLRVEALLRSLRQLRDRLLRQLRLRSLRLRSLRTLCFLDRT